MTQNIDWSEWEIGRNVENKRHEIIVNIKTREKKFIKFLRSNGQDRLKEVISELVTGRLFDRLKIAGLNPQIAIKQGVPVIMMDYKLDARFLYTDDSFNPFAVGRIDPEHTTAIFVIDCLTKNTNRNMRVDHLGWAESLSGKIDLFSFDNGNTFGYGSGDEALEDDSDLELDINTKYKEHISYKMIQEIPLEVAAKIIKQLEIVNFSQMCYEIASSIIEILAPNDYEKALLLERMKKIVTMLERRRTKLIQKIRSWLGISVEEIKPIQEVIPAQIQLPEEKTN